MESNVVKKWGIRVQISYNTEMIPHFTFRKIAKTVEVFGLANLFNSISTLYGLFSAKILFISKCLIKIKTIYIFQHCTAIIFLKSYVNILKKILYYKNEWNLMWSRSEGSVQILLIIPK